jgi:hypothetical protein
MLAFHENVGYASGWSDFIRGCGPCEVIHEYLKEPWMALGITWWQLAKALEGSTLFNEGLG